MSENYLTRAANDYAREVMAADAATLRHYLTEVIDYLEALGDVLTLMPPEMRDPRDLADEIREMLS